MFSELRLEGVLGSPHGLGPPDQRPLQASIPPSKEEASYPHRRRRSAANPPVRPRLHTVTTRAPSGSRSLSMACSSVSLSQSLSVPPMGVGGLPGLFGDEVAPTCRQILPLRRRSFCSEPSGSAALRLSRLQHQRVEQGGEAQHL